MSSQPHPLRESLRARFREAFGETTNSLNREDHWSLLPSPHHLTINVLIESGGPPENLHIWVFDPHDRNDGVMRATIENEQQITNVISQIQQRISQAGRADYPDGEQRRPASTHVSEANGRHECENHRR